MSKYIINQGSGGLVHMLGGIAYCCEYVSKKKSYKLIIDVKNHIGFGNFFSKYFTTRIINFSEDYNDLYKDNYKSFYRIPLKEFENKNVLYDKGYIFTSEKGISVNLNKQLDKYSPTEKILFYVGTGGNNKSLILKHIKCNDEIINKLKNYKIDNKYIGVHFRNTDRSNNINHFINNIRKHNKEYKVYIATDDYKAINIFKKELKEYEIIMFSIPYDANGENIHYNNPNKDEVIMNMLIDMYVLLNSTIFIPSENSLVSRLIIYMRNEKIDIFS